MLKFQLAKRVPLALPTVPLSTVVITSSTETNSVTVVVSTPLVSQLEKLALVVLQLAKYNTAEITSLMAMKSVTEVVPMLSCPLVKLAPLALPTVSPSTVVIISLTEMNNVMAVA